MAKKKRLLEICNQLGIGGTEKVMQILCKYINKDKYDVFACGIFSGGQREELIKNYVLDLLIADGDIEKIKSFIHEKNIDIVHRHSIEQTPGVKFNKSVDLLEFFKLNNIRVIETSPFSLYNKKIDDLLDLKLFVSKTNLIKYFWKFRTQLVDKAKYSFLYNPLDVHELEQYRLNEEQKRNTRKEYGIGEDDFVIGKVGRASLWKWDDTIIDIVPDLVKKIKKLKIVIRAIPEIKKKKIKKMGIEEYFIFLPESVVEKDIADTYQIMDIMMHMSRIGECNSVAINEGLFFGIPIITKPTTFLQKMVFDRDDGQVEIIENGVNGYYSIDNDKIIKAIIKLYENPMLLDKISNNNIKKAYDQFAHTIIVEKLEAFLDGCDIPTFDYDKSFENYKENSEKNSIYQCIKINTQAIWDKYIHNV